MCCSYGYDPGIIRDLELLAERIPHYVRNFPAKDLHPSDEAVILKKEREEEKLRADKMPWGFTASDKKLLINARSETALEKRMFSDGIRHRRCVVPASHFYEWDRNKVKNTFYRTDGGVIYLAGFYDLFENEDRFILLTTAAEGVMCPVHERMPLILERECVKDWIFDGGSIKDMLGGPSPGLVRKTEYEQMSLF